MIRRRGCREAFSSAQTFCLSVRDTQILTYVLSKFHRHLPHLKCIKKPTDWLTGIIDPRSFFQLLYVIVVSSTCPCPPPHSLPASISSSVSHLFCQTVSWRKNLSSNCLIFSIQLNENGCAGQWGEITFEQWMAGVLALPLLPSSPASPYTLPPPPTLHKASDGTSVKMDLVSVIIFPN